MLNLFNKDFGKIIDLEIPAIDFFVCDGLEFKTVDNKILLFNNSIENQFNLYEQDLFTGHSKNI